MPYRLFIPAQYNPQRTYLSLMAPWCGGIGTDNLRQISGVPVSALTFGTTKRRTRLFTRFLSASEPVRLGVAKAPAASLELQMAMDILESVRKQIGILDPEAGLCGWTIAGRFRTWAITTSNPRLSLQLFCATALAETRA